MSLMQWNDQMSTGIDRFDREHKKLIDLLNSLYDAMKAGKGKDVSGTILQELIAYTVTHFANEEKAFAEAGYEEAQRHHDIHEKMKAKVMSFKSDLESGKVSVIDLLNFLTDWLKKHIMETDKKYGPHLTAKGVR